MISENAIVAASKGIESADLDGEAILLDVNSGMYYGLSGVGARVMELLKNPISVRNIIETLKKEYDVGLDQLRYDICSFLQEMEERRIIQILNGEVA